MKRVATLTVLVSMTSLLAVFEARAQSCESPEVCYSCPSAPTLGCGVSAKSSLVMSKSANSADSRLAWTFGWGNGAPTQAWFGDPTSSTSYSLCIYDGSTLKMNGDVEPSATLWSGVGTTGYRYENAAASEGLGSIKQKSGPDAEVSMSVKGKGASLPLPDAAVAGVHYFDPANPVTVQWRVNGGACWSSTFSPANVVTNDGETYEAKF